jgi:hypothetical protein
MTPKEIDQLKRLLFGALLGKSNEELTDNEIDIMVLLCKDDGIQQVLRRRNNDRS